MFPKDLESISFQGGDGSSINNAVKIVGAKSFHSGIQAEFEFIKTLFNENEVESAEGKTIIFPDAVIHHVNVVTRNGENKNIFFNASEFQPKLDFEDVETVKVFTFIN
ncbi:MAG: hypothetical protein HXY50_06455 [Ignavibacteriaceae bacterium]|nr:hypothetical protein [Ignavibacteriaceae bacterium]